MTAPMSFDPIVSSRSPDTSGPESVRKDTRLLLVSNDAMRARRRPAAIVAFYMFQLVLSFIIAWPISRGLAVAFGGHPRGDSVIFDDGGWAVLALRPAYERASASMWGLVTIVVIVASVIALGPLAALLVSLSHATPDLKAPRPRHLAPYVVAALRPLGSLMALGTLLELAILGVAVWAFSFLRESFGPRYGDVRADELAVIGLGLVLLFACAAAVIHDLARASVVRFRTTTFSAIRSALVTFRRSPLRMFWSWAWRALVSLVLVIVVALVVPRFGVRGFGSFAAIAILHQLVVLARTALRASWLARALRAVDASAKKQKSSW